MLKTWISTVSYKTSFYHLKKLKKQFCFRRTMFLPELLSNKKPKEIMQTSHVMGLVRQHLTNGHQCYDVKHLHNWVIIFPILI